MSILNTDLLELHQGDCREKLKQIADESVDLIVTSPPYAEQRKDEYGGIPVDKYVEWFIPIGKELKRICKPKASFFLNIKSHCAEGERHLYVHKLVVAIKEEVGFKFIDEYVWYKSASPRRKTFRLKNAWEPVFHFSLGENFINHDAIKVWSECTFGDKRGYVSKDSITGNVGGFHDIATQVPGWTDPDNILYFPTSLLVRDKYPHPAKFPRELVEFIIKGFCPDNGTVCDPFCGSGMTALAALILKRKCIGIELMPEYIDIIRDRISSYIPPRMLPKSSKEVFTGGADLFGSD